jgi:ATP-dependent DNA helicase 2 subunit 1
LSQDLVEAGITVEPFFISTRDKPFDANKFYSVSRLSRIPFSAGQYPQSVLITTNIVEEENMGDEPFTLPESISITKIEDMLAQMRFHEVPKRSLFSIPFHIADGFTIGIKGYVTTSSFRCSAIHTYRDRYGLVTEQKKGSYQYFVDLGDRLEIAISKTVYVDEANQSIWLSSIPRLTHDIFFLLLGHGGRSGHVQDGVWPHYWAW